MGVLYSCLHAFIHWRHRGAGLKNFIHLCHGSSGSSMQAAQCIRAKIKHACSFYLTRWLCLFGSLYHRHLRDIPRPLIDCGLVGACHWIQAMALHAGGGDPCTGPRCNAKVHFKALVGNTTNAVKWPAGWVNESSLFLYMLMVSARFHANLKRQIEISSVSFLKQIWIGNILFQLFQINRSKKRTLDWAILG